MKRYLVMVEGGDCLIEGLSKTHADRCGFYATRYVEADSQSVAEDTALQMIASEVLGKKMVFNDRSDLPTFRVEETRCISELKADMAVE